jgi:hypothetical protein
MATITVSSDKVVDAATKVIEHIESIRKNRDENEIEVVMSRTRGFFKKYHFTREQAIKYLDQLPHSYFGWRSVYAWGDLEHAKKLLVLAKNGDPVTLNEEDTRVLFG